MKRTRSHPIRERQCRYDSNVDLQRQFWEKSLSGDLKVKHGAQDEELIYIVRGRTVATMPTIERLLRRASHHSTAQFKLSSHPSMSSVQRIQFYTAPVRHTREYYRNGTLTTSSPVQYSPYSHRVRLALDEAGAQYVAHNFPNTRTKPEWYYQINPRGRVSIILHQQPSVYLHPYIHSHDF